MRQMGTNVFFINRIKAKVGKQIFDLLFLPSEDVWA